MNKNFSKNMTYKKHFASATGARIAIFEHKNMCGFYKSYFLK